MIPQLVAGPEAVHNGGQSSQKRHLITTVTPQSLELDTEARDLVEAITRATLRQDFAAIARLLKDHQVNATGILWNPAPDSLRPAALGILWQHWHALRGDSPLPRLDALDIQALPPSLQAHTMLLEAVDGAGWDFCYRHYGEAIVAAAGKNWRGRYVSEMAQASRDALFYLAVYRAVGQLPFPILTVNVNNPRLQAVAWRRLILPLAGDADRVAGFLVGNIPEPLGEETPLEDPGMAIVHEHNNYLQALLQASPIGVGIFPERQHFIFCNDALAQLLRLSHEQLMHRDLASFYQDPALAERHQSQLARRQSLADQEIALTRGDGSCCWAVASFHRTHFQGHEAVLVWLYDVTERKNLEAELRYLATVDPLSEMLNRRAFLTRASQEMARFQRYGHPLSVMMLDIDHFKGINDSYGHEMGDEAIRRVARLMRGALRDSDVLGRLGGEEFAVLLPETALPAALATAQRLRQAVADSELLTPWGRITLTISAGVGDCRPTDGGIDEILSRADRAMYRAKHSGRNRVRGPTPAE